MAVLPILDRRDVETAGPDLISDQISPPTLRVVASGGTTGKPLKIYRDPGDTDRLTRHLASVRAWFGLSSDPKTVALVGRPVGKDGTAKLAGSTLWLGSGHDGIDEDSLTNHYRRMVEHTPQLVRGYPSMLSRIANLMLQRGLSPPTSIVAVETSSEMLFPSQHEVIRRAFQAPHHNLYLQNEHVASASSCGENAELHVATSWSYVELVDDEGNPIFEPGIEGDIIGTSLTNLVAPLIRYRTGDRAAWAFGPCLCGRSGPRFAYIAGRTRDVLTDLDGRHHLLGLGIYGRLVTPETPLDRFQFRHDIPGLLRVSVVPRHSVSSAEAILWTRDALAHLNHFVVEVIAVDDVERTAIGKQPLLVTGPPTSEKKLKRGDMTSSDGTSRRN